MGCSASSKNSFFLSNPYIHLKLPRYLYCNYKQGDVMVVSYDEFLTGFNPVKVENDWYWRNRMNGSETLYKATYVTNQEVRLDEK